MFEKDAIHQRGKALEDEFFHRVDKKLRENLRATMQRDEAVRTLKLATGFKSPALLEHLVDAGFTPPSIAAFALAPLVFVAWADGSISPAERQAILSAALKRGLKNAPSAFAMLESWLIEQPPKSLWKLWVEYADAFGQTLTPTLAEVMHQEILRLATNVAEASGRRFDRGKISAEEQVILDRVAELFLIDSQ